MQFDPRNLRTAQLLHIVDVVNMVVLNQAEHTAHASHDTGLLTVMDVAASHDMAAYFLLQPSVILAAAYRVALHLCRALHMFAGKIVVILFIIILAQRDSAALAVTDLTVLDDPSLRPVRTHHAVLISRRRSPCGCRLIHVKPTERDISDPRLRGHKTITADINLHLLLIGILTLEIGIDHRTAAVLLRIPLINGILRLPGIGIDLSRNTLLECFRLVELSVVEINGPGMSHHRCEIPVSSNKCGVGIVIAEHTVVHTAHPNVIPILLPGFDLLGSCDHRSQRYLAPVNDAPVLTARVLRIHIFPVNTWRYHHLIPSLCHLSRRTNMLKRHFPGTVSVPWRRRIHINCHKLTLLLYRFIWSLLYTLFVARASPIFKYPLHFGRNLLK